MKKHLAYLLIAQSSNDNDKSKPFTISFSIPLLTHRPQYTKGTWYLFGNEGMHNGEDTAISLEGELEAEGLLALLERGPLLTWQDYFHM